jgi:hypothetical protein
VSFAAAAVAHDAFCNVNRVVRRVEQKAGAIVLDDRGVAGDVSCQHDGADAHRFQ